MSGHGSVFLMYHELELAGRPLCQTEPGYVRYILTENEFRQQIHSLKQMGYAGLSVGQALSFEADPAVAITFDDGSETDLITAAPILRKAGFNATFYVTSGFLGKGGYLTPAQLRELDALGFEIGCHSMSHPYLPDLGEPELQREIADAKGQIEQIVGHSIEHFSCPGGRFDRRTLKVAEQAGFRTVANSRYYSNSASTSRMKLGRVAIFRGMSLPAFKLLCSGRGLWKKRASDAARRGVRTLLGNSSYDRLRAVMLGSGSSD